MKVLLCGDVVGRTGRDLILANVPILRSKYSIDIVVVNVDNAAHGFGITEEMMTSLLAAGVDVLTGGNHLFDQKTASSLLAKESRLLRPANMPESTAGHGFIEVTTAAGKKALVVHLIGQKNMPMIGDNPFVYMQKLLNRYQLGGNINAIIVDFHAEVTSEKNALGQFLDGKVSVVVGTHTHVPTADERVLEAGTAFQTDLGMCGDYNSIIGMQKQTIIEKFVKGFCNTRFAPAQGEGTLSALLVETDDSTGLAISARAIRIGGRLHPTECAYLV